VLAVTLTKPISELARASFDSNMRGSMALFQISVIFLPRLLPGKSNNISTEHTRANPALSAIPVPTPAIPQFLGKATLFKNGERMETHGSFGSLSAAHCFWSSLRRDFLPLSYHGQDVHGMGIY